MGMSAFYGATDEDESSQTIHRALELGVNFIDTAQLYGPLTNEELVGRAVAGPPRRVVIATKFGGEAKADAGRPEHPGLDGSPEYVRSRSRARCGASAPTTSTSTTCTASTPTCRSRRPSARWPSWSTPARSATWASARPRRHHPPRPRGPPDHRGAVRVLAVDPRPEAEVLPTCRELGIGFVPYSPLGRGFLIRSLPLAGRARRERLPPPRPALHRENLEANRRIVAKVEEIAAEKGVTPAQLAIAWVLAQGDDLVPIPGTKRRSYLEQNAAAADVALDAADLERWNELPEVSGDRYDETGMASINL